MRVRRFKQMHTQLKEKELLFSAPDFRHKLFVYLAWN